MSDGLIQRPERAAIRGARSRRCGIENCNGRHTSGSVRDITAWRALADCEARFGATFENAGVGIHTDSG
jgi:hypothetical protein